MMCNVLQQPTLTRDDLPPEIRAVTGPVLRVSRGSQGATSDVAVVESAQGVFVVKCAVEQPFRDWLRREYVVLRALAATGLPIPQVYTYVEHATATTACGWLLMEYLWGQPLHAILQSEHRGGVRHDLLVAFGHLLAQVHHCPPPGELAPCGQPWLDEMLQCAAQYLDHYPVDGTPALLAQLERQRPPPVPAALIHGDYTLDNVLVVQQVVTGLSIGLGGRWVTHATTSPWRHGLRPPHSRHWRMWMHSTPDMVAHASVPRKHVTSGACTSSSRLLEYGFVHLIAALKVGIDHDQLHYDDALAASFRAAE